MELTWGLCPFVISHQVHPAGENSLSDSPPVLQEGGQTPVFFCRLAMQQAVERILLTPGVGLYFSKHIKNPKQPKLLNGPESI